MIPTTMQANTPKTQRSINKKSLTPPQEDGLGSSTCSKETSYLNL